MKSLSHVQSVRRSLVCAVFLVVGGFPVNAADNAALFRTLAEEYVDQMPALSPVSATQIGDHRFDAQMDDVSEASRERILAFSRGFLSRLGKIDRDALPRELQVDAALFKNELQKRVWHLETFQDWAWNPLIYTGKAGGAIYGLMAREFAPTAVRLRRVTDRLEKLPSFFE